MTANSIEARSSRNVRWLTLNTLLLALVGVLALTYPVEELNRRLGDAFFRLRPAGPQSEAVALVLIDDTSLERIGRWPWPRAQLAKLLNAVSAQHPSAVGLDILLTEPGDKSGDAALAQAIRSAGNVVLAAKLSGGGKHLWSDPIAPFFEAAAGIGHVQAVMDPDGIVRRVPVIELSAHGQRWPLAVEAAHVATRQPIWLDGNILRLKDQRIPVEGKPRRDDNPNWASFHPQFLNIDFHRSSFAGQPSPFFSISASKVLEKGAPTGLQGRAVLIGFGASDLSDRFSTPVTGRWLMPGVELHANLLNGVLVGRGVRHAPVSAQILLLIAFLLISTWWVLRRPGWASIWIPLTLFLGSYVGAFFVFLYRGVLLDFGPLACAALLAVPIAQLENLAVVNHALNRGLLQLRRTLSSSPREGLTSLQPNPRTQDATRNLPQKLDLIQELQSELSTLYGFQRNLLASMQEGLAVFDRTGAMEFCNPFWERFCLKQGWDTRIRLADFGRSLGHPRWSNLESTIGASSLPRESEVYLGGGFWQVRSLRLNADGTAPRWMLVVTDLTSRLERDQTRAEALRFVTHELRTPLVSIQGFAEFLLRYPSAKTRSEAAATIFRESQRLVSLINTYLDVLRFDAGAQALRKEPVDIPAMVAQVEKVMAPIAESAEIRIQTELEPDVAQCLSDAPMFVGVLLNLLNNAVKYSPAGSAVFFRVWKTGDLVNFEVSNPGEVIPQEQLSHLFDPFYRIREQDGSKPGWGLGLTFVKRIVEEHNGTIEARSDESGIRVRIAIPAAASSPSVGPA